MAGGLGSRYQGLKQVDAVLESGETLLEFSIYDAIICGFDKIVLVLNKKIETHFIEKIKIICTSRKVVFEYVFQEISSFVPHKYFDAAAKRQKPLGTAHAILCARNLISESFVVINADDFYGRNTFEKAFELLKNKKIDDFNYQMIAFEIASTLSENGSVSRGICTVDNHDKLIKIDEHTEILKIDSQIISVQNKKVLDGNSLSSMNFWCFGKSIFEHLEKEFLFFLENLQTEKQEFFIPMVVQKLILQHKISVKVSQTLSIWFGLTYADDKILLQTEIQKLIKNDVYPEKLWLS